MPAQNISRSADLLPGQRNRTKSNTLRVDSDTDTMKFGTSTSGTTEKEVADLSSTQTVTGNKTFTGTVAMSGVVTSTGDGAVQYAEVALTNAEIKALRATPKTLVAAPAAGKVLKFLGALLILDAGANVLTESTANLGIKYTDGSGVQVNETVEATGFIDQAVDTATEARPKLDPIVAKTGNEAKALVLHNLGGGEYAGNVAADALMRVKIWYSVITTGW